MLDMALGVILLQVMGAPNEKLELNYFLGDQTKEAKLETATRKPSGCRRLVLYWLLQSLK